MIECGDTSLLVTATKTAKKEVGDFLPLICDYEEKLYPNKLSLSQKNIIFTRKKLLLPT